MNVERKEMNQQPHHLTDCTQRTQTKLYRPCQMSILLREFVGDKTRTTHYSFALFYANCYTKESGVIEISQGRFLIPIKEELLIFKHEYGETSKTTLNFKLLTKRKKNFKHHAIFL